MLSYLLSRLTQAQGFCAYTSKGRTTDPRTLMNHARHKTKGVKGARYDLTLHRYYGKHPQERSSSVFVVLPVWVRDNNVELEPGKVIRVRQPDYNRYPKRGWEIHSVPAQRSHKDTWMTLLATIEQIRAPRRRENHAA